MEYQIINNINNINIHKLNEYVLTHPYVSYFQIPKLYSVYEKTKNYEPVFLAVVDELGEIHATLLAVIQKEHSGGLGKFSSRSIIVGGPLIKNGNSVVLDIILKEYATVIKNRAVYSQFRNSFEWGNLNEVFLENGYSFEEHLNILIDLTKSVDDLWKDIHPKRRNEIRRALKEGTSFFIKNELPYLSECYGILISVYKRARLPLPDYSYFESLYNISDEKSGLRIFCAVNKGRIIGCMIALVINNLIYDLYAGSLPEYYNKYPNDLIPWGVFLWGKENGYTQFDFGGAGKPRISYGVREYKRKFGGVFISYGRFIIIHNSLIYYLAKTALKSWQFLKK